MICTHIWAVLKDKCWLRFRFSFFYVCLGFAFLFFWFTLDYFVLMLFALIVLGLVSSVPCQEIGREERLQNDLFCVKWDVKPLLSQICKDDHRSRAHLLVRGHWARRWIYHRVWPMDCRTPDLQRQTCGNTVSLPAEKHLYCPLVVLIFHPTEGRRMSWLEWQVTYQDCTNSAAWM